MFRQSRPKQAALCEAATEVDWAQWLYVKVHRAAHQMLRSRSGQHCRMSRPLPRPQTGILSIVSNDLFDIQYSQMVVTSIDILPANHYLTNTVPWLSMKEEVGLV